MVNAFNSLLKFTIMYEVLPLQTWSNSVVYGEVVKKSEIKKLYQRIH